MYLAPLMRFMASTVEKRLTEIPRPTDAPSAHSSGLDPDRILVIGSGLASGWGVRTNDLALPGHLARELTRLTSRGTDVDLITDHRMTVADGLSAIARVDLQRYDAVVVTLGVTDAMQRTRRSDWEQHMDELLNEIATRSSFTTHALVTGIQPIRSIPVYNTWWGQVADRRAHQFNHITEALVGAHVRMSYVDLPGERIPNRRHTDPVMYQRWAKLLATHLAAQLDAAVVSAPQATANSARGHRSRPQAEGPRQRAVEDMQLVGGTPTPNLQRIVNLAREMFGTQAAAVSVIDGDRQWLYAKSGIDLDHVPRSQSFCAATISSSSELVVSDANVDPKFRHFDAVARKDIGFYAGHPIESPDGYRIGALCILDPLPRRFSQDDRSALRDLALRVQQELWVGWAGPSKEAVVVERPTRRKRRAAAPVSAA